MGWMILLSLAALGGLLLGALTRLYVKTPANMAFIRTGLGGKKVVLDRGALVLPYVQSLQWLSLETFKLEVFKATKEAFITKDRMRVDLGAEFYMKIPAEPAALEQAARSLGEKSFSAGAIQARANRRPTSSSTSESGTPPSRKAIPPTSAAGLRAPRLRALRRKPIRIACGSIQPSSRPSVPSSMPSSRSEGKRRASASRSRSSTGAPRPIWVA